ncbi:hypothetical protein GCM10011390_41020 [Aureimonas endophytica]|uniref:TonB C-terminal domain-containing protein n=1 Tax=Aureimonas endophytica TaxID=2027858 RepID=A0A917EBP2_9HYPH|nr:energy transducer TonB [Aureimonas endophytica]GGE17671.1 hypothetical protein GCM10011390_41020 [Aureimonas endophytica]
MTLFLDDPRRIAGESLSAGAARWGFSGVAVALAFSGALFFAAQLPAPQGAQGDLNDAVIIDLEPMEALEEAPPPAPAPEPPVEQPVAETPPPPPEPVVEQPPPPEPPPPEPQVEAPPEPAPPPPEPIVEPVPPEPVAEQPPPPEPAPPEPEPIPQPEPVPAPEPLPDLPQNEAAEAVLNAPPPAPRPAPPRPKVEKAEAKPRPVKKKPEPAKPRPARQASTAPQSSAPAARNTASAPQVSQATWARQVISRIRAQAPRSAGAAGLTARVSFSIDRGGRIISAGIASSSGDGAFDREAVALVRRASPVPAPPDGVGSRTTALTVPIRAR